MPRIAHFADIHWHGSSRHEEYKQSFTAAFNDLKKKNIDSIVICGDIFHTKTQGITPEVIDHLTWWFKSMADIAPVTVMLGNHDGNLVNLTRQDAISPIINAINSPNISLYKKSGTYKSEFEDISWCVFSPFDEDKWINVKPDPNTLNIALFHGCVKGAKTDMMFELEHSDVNVNFFNEYDFALLGDIHMLQYLGHRDGKPWIAYPGSSIQQNFGEKQGKGYLLWDIKSRDDFDVEFCKIPHDMPFVTLKWEGTVKKTLPKTLARGARVRVQTKQPITQKQATQLENELKIAKLASSVTYSNDYSVDEVAAKSSLNIQKEDLRSPDAIKRMVKEYYSKDPLHENDLKTINTLIDDLFPTALATEAVERGTRWSIDKIKFDNIFGYGEGNVIDFSKLNGVTGIFGPNKIGKSSIIGAILYALFNDTDRGSVKNIHIINTRHKHCYVCVDFDVDGKKFRVERQTVKVETKKSVSAKTNLNFFEIDASGDVIKDLGGEQRRDTEKVIRKKLGDVADIMLTGISTQGNSNRFIEVGSTTRDQAISKFLGLSIFEKLFDLAKEKSSDLKARVKNAPDRDWVSLIEASENSLDESKKKIKKIEADIFLKREESKEIDFKLRDASAVITKLDVEIALNDVKSFQEELQEMLNKQVSLKTKLFTATSVLADKKKYIDSYSTEDLEKQKKNYYELSTALTKIENLKDNQDNLVKRKKKSSLKLLDVPCGDMFPTCKYIKDSYQDKLSVKKDEEKLLSLIESVKKANDSIKVIDIKDIDDRLNKHNKLVKEIADLSILVAKAKAKCDNLDKDIDRKKSELLNASEKYEKYTKEAVDENETNAIQKLKEQNSEIQTCLRSLDVSKINIASEIGQLNAEILRLKEEKILYESLFKEWKCYELFMNACSKKGLPADVIRSQLPLINAEIQKLLQSVADFSVIIEKSEGSSTVIYIDYGDSRRILELGSGAEKMISSLAIRTALVNATSLPRPDFLIIDEGFGTLDDKGIISCRNFILSLRAWFKNVLIITHVDSLKDAADSIIEITKEDDNDSQVKVL